jgi:hypothetical protein
MLSTTLATLAPVLSSISVANPRRRIVHGSAAKIVPPTKIELVAVETLPVAKAKRPSNRKVVKLATPDDIATAVGKARSTQEKIRLLLLACDMGTR